MSDDFLILVPRNPNHVPTLEAQEGVVEVLARIAPNAESSTAQQTDIVQFFDCGENFAKVSCPLCSEELDLEWWHECMDQDEVGEGFKLNAYELPCCGGKATLNELNYDWPQAFGRFRWEVMNPDIGALSEADRRSLESAADCPLVFVRQHI